jgi:hypothetical protein
MPFDSEPSAARERSRSNRLWVVPGLVDFGTAATAETPLIASPAKLRAPALAYRGLSIPACVREPGPISGAAIGPISAIQRRTGVRIGASRAAGNAPIMRAC